VASGLVAWWPEEPTCPVEIRHPLVRDAIYADITAARRRLLHARAASVVSESASWEHRVAALDHPDESLAAELEHLADEEVAGGHLVLAATHLWWASDISPARADRERRLLTAALYLPLADEPRGLALRPAVEEAAPSPLRGAAEEAEHHARLAEEAAASLDYGQEGMYAAMARALVCQAAGDYLGMADALDPWHDDAALDDRSRMYAVLWRPLLAEGLIGSGQAERAALVLEQLRVGTGQVSYIQPALAWLDGWLAEQRDHPEEALRIYQRGEGTVSTRSPVHTARLLLAHGRLLRRTGNRKDAVERLRQAHALFSALRAAPFIARTEAELAECHLPGGQAKTKQSVLALTSRETEVAHLVGKGLSNPEIAAELFISRKAVEYHLGNIYAKCGVQGRQQLRRFAEQWRQPAMV
jgi:DNA-binding CsgD family transcriptional regulator